MNDKWTKLISGDRLVRFTYCDLPAGAAFMTAQIANHEVVYSDNFGTDWIPLQSRRWWKAASAMSCGLLQTADTTLMNALGSSQGSVCLMRCGSAVPKNRAR